MLEWLMRFSKGHDWRGRMKCLLGRNADPAMCQVSGVDPQTTERALGIICEAFAVHPRANASKFIQLIDPGQRFGQKDSVQGRRLALAGDTFFTRILLQQA
jgi:hypothetical protein